MIMKSVEMGLRKIQEQKQREQQNSVRGEDNSVQSDEVSNDVIQVLRNQFSLLKGRGVKRSKITVEEAQEWKALIDSLILSLVYYEIK